MRAHKYRKTLRDRRMSRVRDVVVKFQGKVFTGRAVPGKSWFKDGNPVVLIMPDIMGCKTLDLFRCTILSELLGCAAVAVDLYGEAFPPNLREDRANIGTAFQHMNNLLCDPVTLRGLMRTYIDEAVKQLNGDPKRVAAIGFCFGGGCVVEMIRDGAPLIAGVSMHGTLEAKPLAPMGGGAAAPPMKTERPPPRHTSGVHLLACHGYADPLVPPAVVDEFMKEMSAAPLGSFTFASYGNVVHAFTTPNTPPNNAVLSFNANAARRAWVSAIDLLSQAFDVPSPGPIPSELWVNSSVVGRL